MKLFLGLFIAISVSIGGGVYLYVTNDFTKSKGGSISEESLGLRTTDLYTETTTTGDKTNYSTQTAGTSTKIKRDFDGAPPMIPHDVTNFLPITAKSNSCLGCHMPTVAMAMGATPIPKSHFTDYRPKYLSNSVVQKDKINAMQKENVAQPLQDIAKARYSCTLCHAPQSQGKLPIQNNF